MNSDTIKNVAELIRQADAVLVGAGSGMSSAAGYNHYHYITMKCSKSTLKILNRFTESETFFRDFIMFTQSQSSNGDFIPDILHSWKCRLLASRIVISMNA